MTKKHYAVSFETPLQTAPGLNSDPSHEKAVEV
jgi:hypothetical protein